MDDPSFGDFTEAELTRSQAVVQDYMLLHTLKRLREVFADVKDTELKQATIRAEASLYIGRLLPENLLLTQRRALRISGLAVVTGDMCPEDFVRSARTCSTILTLEALRREHGGRDSFVEAAMDWLKSERIAIHYKAVLKSAAQAFLLGNISGEALVNRAAELVVASNFCGAGGAG